MAVVFVVGCEVRYLAIVEEEEEEKEEEEEEEEEEEKEKEKDEENDLGPARPGPSGPYTITPNRMLNSTALPFLSFFLSKAFLYIYILHSTFYIPHPHHLPPTFSSNLIRIILIAHLYIYIYIYIYNYTHFRNGWMEKTGLCICYVYI